MGNDRGWRSLGVALTPWLLVAAACGAGGGDDGPGAAASADTTSSTATSSTDTDANGLRPCADDRHAIVVDMDGTLTANGNELLRSIADPAYDPLVRPGAVDLLATWRSRGYEIVYLTERPASLKIGNSPMVDATGAWLRRHRFPTGDGTLLEVWDDASIPRVDQYKTEVLVGLTVEGVAVDYGYTDAAIDVLAYRTAGIAADHIFTVGDATSEPGTVAVHETGWLAHQLTVVESLPEVCTS
jgi:hypothetical protein